MSVKNALIGYSGFVGSTLLKQCEFSDKYRSTNISEIQNKSFDTVVCAGAPAVKWLANKNPEQDQESIKSLISNLSTVKCGTFILISTVDVFKDSEGVDESTKVDTVDLHPYGFNRYKLEEFVRKNFKRHLIVRLPGLVGPGLKKNILYDFLNSNNLEVIDSRGVFQFYPMVNLWADIKTALENDLSLIHLTSAPISVGEVAQKCFNFDFDNCLENESARYDFRSNHSDLYEGDNKYQYTQKEIILAIRSFAQSENKKSML